MITLMTASAAAPSLLDRVYDELDLVNGTLLDAAYEPNTDSAKDNWRNLGDWLLLAARVRAERIFFVNDDPVLVFATLPENAAEETILEAYQRTWSLGRPRCLFLLCGNELRVYSLAIPPPAADDPESTLTPLEVITRASQIHELLADFHRDRLELGPHSNNRIFVQEHGRAEHQLLLDVQTATRELITAGLSHQTAHDLIERAILVRYLEDRRILTPEYIDELVPPRTPPKDSSSSSFASRNLGATSRFITLLDNKTQTYSLFDALARKFNGDLFLTDDTELDAVHSEHLLLLQDMLLGKPRTGQQPLFLWAYDFNVVPTTLISTMYELFHHQADEGAEADTHYTPSNLVDFVLGSVLTADVLNGNPRLCDPACGSGIFLAEAYHRIVRHETLRSNRRLSKERLKELLLTRIAGCDLDRSAVRLAAFSLYVAYLNYQSPHDIASAGELPKLIHPGGDDVSFAPLVVGDAFWPLDGEAPLTADTPSQSEFRLPWREKSFDVVVGNPPWTQHRGRKTLGELWAHRQAYPIGQRSPSQLFLWRSLHLLSESGVAALLIGANTMVNAQKSKDFRRLWLRKVHVQHVVNFTQVRADFFSNAVAPFLLMKFAPVTPHSNRSVTYENARRIRKHEPSAPALARLERHIVSQSSLQARDYLWKTYTAGSIRDETLMARLALENRLEEYAGSGRIVDECHNRF